MNFNEYQEKAMSFRLPSASMSYALLGIGGEVGELYSYIAKAERDDTEVDPYVLQKELGDILWFISAISADLGLSLEDVALANIDKLADRKARDVIKGSGDDR